MAINTKDWSAYENRQPPVNPAATPFYVIGKVETNNGAHQPKLTKIVPQGINPTILLLELTITSGGTGTGDVALRPARYDAQVQQGQYKTVEVLYGRQTIATIEVKAVH